MSVIHVGEDGVIVVGMPPQNATLEDSRDYLNQVRQELDATLAKCLPFGKRHRIDLENGRRGGYFCTSSTALSELLTETVDFVRNTRHYV